MPLPSSWVASDDFAGLAEAFGEAPRPKRVPLRKVTASADEAPAEALRQALAAQYGKVLSIFRLWDEDGNGLVDAREFRQALPMLGLDVDRAASDALFATFDADGSGCIDYDELRAQLRPGADVELDAAMRDGAMGEIETGRSQRHALRGAIEYDPSAYLGGSAFKKLSLDPDTPVIKQVGLTLTLTLALTLTLNLTQTLALTLALTLTLTRTRP